MHFSVQARLETILLAEKSTIKTILQQWKLSSILFLTLLTMQQNAFLLIIHFIIKGQFNHKNVCGSGYHCSTSKEFCIACNWPGNLNKKSLIAHLPNANSAVHSAWLVEDMGEHSAAKLTFLPLHSTAKQTVQMAYCHHGLLWGGGSPSILCCKKKLSKSPVYQDIQIYMKTKLAFLRSRENPALWEQEQARDWYTCIKQHNCQNWQHYQLCWTECSRSLGFFFF